MISKTCKIAKSVQTHGFLKDSGHRTTRTQQDLVNKIAHQTLARMQILVLICEGSGGHVIDKKPPKIQITAGQICKDPKSSEQV